MLIVFFFVIITRSYICCVVKSAKRCKIKNYNTQYSVCTYVYISTTIVWYQIIICMFAYSEHKHQPNTQEETQALWQVNSSMVFVLLYSVYSQSSSPQCLYHYFFRSSCLDSWNKPTYIDIGKNYIEIYIIVNWHQFF